MGHAAKGDELYFQRRTLANLAPWLALSYVAEEMVDVWIAREICVWRVLNFLDNVLTDYIAGMYAARDPKVLELVGGYELTPQYEDEIAQLKLFSPRFIRSLHITASQLFSIWSLG